MVITPSFQVGDVDSIPIIRSVGHCEQAARRIDVFHSQTQSLIWLGLFPFSITVVQLFLVQFVEVRILEGEQKDLVM